jgi:hypothetical protein
MIQERMRELVAEIRAASDDWSLAQRTEEIGGAEAAIAMLQALLNVEVVAFEDQRKAADRAAGASPAMAGSGASAEIAMARGVSRATVDYQLAFAVSWWRTIRGLWMPAWTGRYRSRQPSTSWPPAMSWTLSSGEQ